jgi:hypothetical protein
MFEGQIKDRTVKDIFENLLGKESAYLVLNNVQKAYDSGLRGEELRDFAEHAINENLKLQPDSLRIVVAAIAIIVI